MHSCAQVVSWCTYPIVYIIPMLGATGSGAVVGIQIGYCISDIGVRMHVGVRAGARACVRMHACVRACRRMRPSMHQCVL